MSQTQRILVTGSGGRLGRLLRIAARHSGHSDTEFMFQSSGASADVQWTPDQPVEHLPRCEMVVALWGATGGDETALSVNAKLVDLSRKVAKACGATRVVHMSSAGVYGPGEFLKETDACAPVTSYGHAKAVMERAILQGSASDRTEDTILRLANVVGADSLAPALRRDAPVELHRYADGRGPQRSYLSAGDLLGVLRHLALAAKGTVPKVLNVASVSAIGMEELALAAGKEITWFPAPADAVQSVTLDLSNLMALFPQVELSQTAEALVGEWASLEAQK